MSASKQSHQGRSNPRYPCTYHLCSKDYASEPSLRRHQEQNHLDPFPKGCTFCGWMIQDEEAMVHHLYKRHLPRHQGTSRKDAAKQLRNISPAKNDLQAQNKSTSSAAGSSNIPTAPAVIKLEQPSPDHFPGQYPDTPSNMSWVPENNGQYYSPDLFSDYGVARQA